MNRLVPVPLVALSLVPLAAGACASSSSRADPT